MSSYPEAPERVEIAQRLSAGQSLSAEAEARLAALGRPVFVLVEAPARRAAAELWGAPAIAAEDLALFRWRTEER